MSRTGGRYQDGRAVYLCDWCGLSHPWTERSLWFGSYADQDSGDFLSYCSRRCADEHARSERPNRPPQPARVMRGAP